MERGEVKCKRIDGEYLELVLPEVQTKVQIKMKNISFRIVANFETRKNRKKSKRKQRKGLKKKLQNFQL
jgi:hypothetical protein